MEGTMLALGRGLVKLMISLFVGGGVGLITFGVTTKDVPDLWTRNYPPPGFFTAIGAGLLSCAFVMAVLFIVPRFFGPSRARVSLTRSCLDEVTNGRTL